MYLFVYIFAVKIIHNMLQGILLSDGYWITISHSYLAVRKRRLYPRRIIRSNGLSIGYHHCIFLNPRDLHCSNPNNYTNA